MAIATPIRRRSPAEGYIPPSDTEQALVDDIANFRTDPLGFVLYAYPWGEKGTDLADRDGPNKWQTDALEHAGKMLRDGRKMEDVIEAVIQIAIASGHGVGKSAFIVWLIQWGMATCVDTRGVVTANTETQLRTKTWPEMAKWHRISIVRSWFTLTATSYYSTDKEHEKTWRFDMVPWSETNTEAFAGLHNQGRRIILCMDEGSKIPDLIWETAEGALTDKDTEIIWVVCGNPTQNTGRFRECFESFKHRWWTRQVDSREVPFTNKVKIKEWEDDYGEDSDFFRVRVRGVFPRAGAQQLISSDLVDLAMNRQDFHVSIYDPLILGTDVARFGDDQSVIAIKKGKDGRTHPPMKFRGIDTMQLARHVVDTYQSYKADGNFVDGGGVGGGVVDRIRELKYPVHEVNFGGKPDKITLDGTHEKAYNKRAEMWLSFRQWLRDGGVLPKDPDLRKQIIQQTYEFRTIRGGDAIILTSKEAMKADGLDSPDIADAYVLLFAYPVMMDPRKEAGYATAGARQKDRMDYDPLATDDQLEQQTNQPQYRHQHTGG